jgi:hypothetical protein
MRGANASSCVSPARVKVLQCPQERGASARRMSKVSCTAVLRVSVPPCQGSTQQPLARQAQGLALTSAPVHVELPAIQAHQVQCQLARQQLHIQASIIQWLQGQQGTAKGREPGHAAGAEDVCCLGQGLEVFRRQLGTGSGGSIWAGG